MWEDETNKNGGRWLISLDKKQRNHELNAFWLEIVSGPIEKKKKKKYLALVNKG